MSETPAVGRATVAESALPVATGRVTGRELWRLSRGHRVRLAVVGLLGIASAAIDLLPPVAIGFFVDRVQSGEADLGAVLMLMAVIVAATVVGAAGTAVTIVLATRVYQTLLATLRERLVGQAMTLSQQRVEQAGTGDLISRTNDDVTAVADAAPTVIPALTVTAFTVVVSLGGLAALEWPYAVAVVVTLPVYVIAMRWYLRTGPRVYLEERAAMSVRAQQILESQRGYATVLGFGLAPLRHGSVMSASWEVSVRLLRTRIVQSMLNTRLNVGECLSLVVILIVGFVLIGNGASTIGGATTAMLIMLRLLSPVNQLLFVVDTIQSALASLNRMIGVIVITESPSPAVPIADTATAVRLSDVTFRYGDGPLVLDNITLAIPHGQHLAIVGASSAGKTTLAAVIAGIHPPSSGMVARPSRTAVITQEIHVFAGTLRDNLTLAAPDATDEEIRAALEATGAAVLFELLPDGLDTVLGTGGHALTDAQAQQIALARLSLANPELAILDEATAEAGSTHADLLDQASQAVIMGRTAMVIAHRLSQAAVCDRIIVMDGGRVVEIGSHDDLVKAGGAYSKLWHGWVTATDITEGIGR